MPRTFAARSSSFALPSGFTTDLSKSKRTSAAKVTFSATGFGFGAGSGGFGAGAGAGAGVGAGCGSGLGAGFGGSCVAQAASARAATKANALDFIPPPVLSMACESAERILPEGHTSVQAREGIRLQLALAQLQSAVDPDVRYVLASRGIDEMRDDVVAGRELRPAQRHRGEIGRFADGNRADLVGDAKRSRAPERCRFERVVSRHCLRVMRHRLREQRCGAHLLEEVQAIVACGAVGAERDVDARRRE